MLVACIPEVIGSRLGLVAHYSGLEFNSL